MLDQTAFQAAVKEAVEAATAWSDQMTTDRNSALDYYYQRPLGTEVDGQSQVVTSDVADTIEWIMPTLMRIFMGGRDIVKFEPQGMEDADAAKQASDYCDYIFTRDNPGFRLLYDWFKDALLQRNGVVKVWWDKSVEVNPETYLGLSDPELAFILADKTVQVVAHNAHQMPDGLTAHDVQVVRRRDHGRCRVATVPPEEFLIAPDALNLDDAPFCGHRKLRTESDLIDEGWPADLVRSLPSGGVSRLGEAQLKRRESEDGTRGYFPQDRTSGAMRAIEWVEGYIRFDYDQDGIAELHQVNYAGGRLLSHSPVEIVPFADLTPVPMPHVWEGRSLADQTMDIQLIRSTLARQGLSNVYQANNARVTVVADQVNLDDLLTPRPGGVVRVKTQGAVAPLPVMPMLKDIMGMVEYWDSQREVRTGVTRYSQGTDANTLNKTASGINLIQGAGAQRVELIARIFAETGVKRMFRLILRCVAQNQQRERVVRLRNKWVPVDPRGWNHQMDATVTVGIGTGNRDVAVANVANLLAVMEKIIGLQKGIEGPFVFPQHLHAALSEMCEAMGFKSSEQFFADPREAPPAPKAPEQPTADAILKAKTDVAIAQMQETTKRMGLAVDAKKIDVEQDAKAAEAWLQGQQLTIDAAKAARDADSRDDEIEAKRTAGRPKEAA